MCEFEGSILAVGGYGLSSVESFTPPVDFSDPGQLGQWTDIQSMTREMCVYGLVVLPDGIFAAGMMAETWFHEFDNYWLIVLPNCLIL